MKHYLLDSCEYIADRLFDNFVAIAVLAVCAGFIIAAWQDEVAERQVYCIDHAGKWDAATSQCVYPSPRQRRIGH